MFFVSWNVWMGPHPHVLISRFLNVRFAISTADTTVTDAAVAYPPPGYRVRKLERILYGRIGRAPVQRVNREVFRRAAATALGDGLVSSTLGPVTPATVEKAGSGWGLSRRTGILLGALAVAALVTKGETVLDDEACVAVSYPYFFQTLDKLL